MARIQMERAFRELSALLEESQLAPALRNEPRNWPGGLSSKEIIDTLWPYLSASRQSRIEKVVASRSRGIVPVLERLINVGNVNAILRSAEAFGFQRVDLVTSAQPLKTSPRTSMGAHKWLDLVGWPSLSECLDGLKDDGYRLVALHPDPDARPVADIDFSQPTALLFGSEKIGLSDEARSRVDECVRIDMPGFTPSLNVSVAAAITLHQARCADPPRCLSPAQREDLKALYTLKSTPHAAPLLLRRRDADDVDSAIPVSSTPKSF